MVGLLSSPLVTTTYFASIQKKSSGCLFFPRLAKIKEWVDAHDPGALVIPVSGAVESKLLDMEEEERTKYCEEQKTQRWDVDGL